jgi:hypothetical protein
MVLSLPMFFYAVLLGTVEQAAVPFVKWTDYTFGAAEYVADRLT